MIARIWAGHRDPFRQKGITPTQAEPKLWCGLDRERKPIYVVDQQGRIIREPAMENPTIVVLTDRNDLDDQLFGKSAVSSF